MESFERYAGFFPEAALSMMEREGRNRGADRLRFMPDAHGLATLSLASGVWADAILPEVMDYLPGEPRPVAAPAARTITWRGVAHRLRRALSRA